MAKARADALTAILASDSARKLVVAGPGTGKTHTFRELLSEAGDNNLALTFLRNLVSDLEESLQQVAAVYSFHGFAHLMLRATDVPGITEDPRSGHEQRAAGLESGDEEVCRRAAA